MINLASLDRAYVVLVTHYTSFAINIIITTNNKINGNRWGVYGSILVIPSSLLILT